MTVIGITFKSQNSDLVINMTR